jgi:hypothetical protein
VARAAGQCLQKKNLAAENAKSAETFSKIENISALFAFSAAKIQLVNVHADDHTDG